MASTKHKNREFAITQVQVDRVAKVIGTDHFLLCAVDPKTIKSDTFSWSLVVQQLSVQHRFKMADRILDGVLRDNPLPLLERMVGLLGKIAGANGKKE